MNTFAFLYSYDPNNPAIAEIRPRHREFCSKLKEEGTVIGTGPFVDGDGGALLVVRLPKPSTLDDATAIMGRDPFYAEGALTGRTAHTWNPVINIFED